MIVRQFRQAGFEASFKAPTNTATLLATGDVDIFLAGISGAVRGPYVNLLQYHSRYALAAGQPALYPHRWKNAEFDAIVDETGTIETGESRFMDLYRGPLLVIDGAGKCQIRPRGADHAPLYRHRCRLKG